MITATELLGFRPAKSREGRVICNDDPVWGEIAGRVRAFVDSVDSFTSRELKTALGLPDNFAHAYILKLEKRGLVKRIGKKPCHRAKNNWLVTVWSKS